jgi:acyl-CoA dehydrogenase
VFLTDVRVPVANVVGELDGGWTPARTTLANESALIGASTHAGSGADALVALARASGLAADPLVRQRLVAVVERERILDWLRDRVQADLLSGRAPTLDGSVLKVLWSRDRAAKGELAIALLGPTGALSAADAPRGGFWQTQMLNRFWASIGGGTDEIHRTMIGERALGLPAEPRVDRHVAFRVL